MTLRLRNLAGWSLVGMLACLHIVCSKRGRVDRTARKSRALIFTELSCPECGRRFQLAKKRYNGRGPWPNPHLLVIVLGTVRLVDPRPTTYSLPLIVRFNSART